MKMKNGKKINLFSVVLKNRHFLVAVFLMFTIIFVMYDSFVVNAETARDGSTYEVEDSFVNYYGIEEPYPYLSWSVIREDFVALGYGTYDNIVTALNFDSGASSLGSAYSGVYDDNNIYGMKVISQVGTAGNVITSNDGYFYYGYDWSSGSSQKFRYNYRLSSSGNLAYINNYIVSDAPINYIYTKYMAYWETIIEAKAGTIDNAAANGYYMLDCTYLRSCFTDLPIYVPSTSGSTGFTGLTVDSTDFSFDADNFNFNYLITDDLIIDHNGNNGSQGSDVGKHYNFASVTPKYEGLPDSSGYTVKTRWVLNDYIINHPELYEVHFVNDITVKADNGNERVYTRTDIVPMSSILANDDTDYQSTYLFREFLRNGETLKAFLEDNWASVTGSSSGYYTDNSIISYGGTNPNTTRSFGGFKLGVGQAFRDYYQLFKLDAEIYMTFVGGNLDTSSGSFKATYNFLSGETTINQNDISENLDPPTESMLPATYTQNGGSNGGSGNIVQNANPNIIIQNGGGGLTQAYTIDDVNIASLADTMNYIVDTLGNDRQENGFWAVMKNTYDYFPSGFWNIMLLGITTVVGISVVKVTLSLYRNR